MTFKEKLIEKAEQINIEKEMDYIKRDMESYFSYRKYEIRLYEAHCRMAIGSKSGYNTNYAEFFVPDNISGKEYTNLFITKLKELGFNSDKDISIEVIEQKEYDLHTITVRW